MFPKEREERDGRRGKEKGRRRVEVERFKYSVLSCVKGALKSFHMI